MKKELNRVEEENLNIIIDYIKEQFNQLLYNDSEHTINSNLVNKLSFLKQLYSLINESTTEYRKQFLSNRPILFLNIDYDSERLHIHYNSDVISLFIVNGELGIY